MLLLTSGRLRPLLAVPSAYGRFSNEDPAKSGLEPKRIFDAERGFS